jgi:hypothetical protein
MEKQNEYDQLFAYLINVSRVLFFGESVLENGSLFSLADLPMWETIRC